MNNNQKLELTWIGKDQQPRLELHILIEDPLKSYEDRESENGETLVKQFQVTN